jgi:hypothetical protein
MLSFKTPSEAKSVLISIILAQAAIEGVSLSEFEQKLLESSEIDESPTEEELEQFDDEQGEEFWNKIALLIKHAGSRVRSEQGSEAQKGFRDCIELAAHDNGYLAGILFLRGFANWNDVPRWNTVLQIAAASLIGSVIFLGAIFYFSEHSPRPWIEAHTKSLSTVENWVSMHTLWLTNPYGWFQEYGGYVMLAALFSYAIYAYGSIIRAYVREKK